jgi:hypothetical protein
MTSFVPTSGGGLLLNYALERPERSSKIVVIGSSGLNVRVSPLISQDLCSQILLRNHQHASAISLEEPS